MTEKPAADRWAIPGSTTEPDPAPNSGPSRTGSPAGPVPASSGQPGKQVTSGASFGAAGLLVEDEAGGVPRLALRPLTVADILDGAFGVIKARPARLLGFTAIFVIPVTLVTVYLQRDALGGTLEWWDALAQGEVDAQDGSQVNGSLLDVFYIWALSGIALVYVAAGISYLLGGWAAGRDPALGELLATVLKRSWALLASFVLVHLAEAGGLLACYVGVVFIMPLFVAVAPVIGAEGGGPLHAMQRSFRLTRGRYWPVLGISLLIGLVSILLDLALSGGPELLALLLGFDIAWPLMALAGVAGGVVVTPFVAGATVLLYLDLRVRSEGLDLEMAAGDVFRRQDG